jgi:redox-sensing transcriptional repressor
MACTNRDLNMKPPKRSKSFDARLLVVPTAPKTAFPESLLHQAIGARKAGLPCVKRMPAYLQLLRVLQSEGQEHVSGTVLASVHNLEPVIVRKDLAITGAVGTPRIGFRITELISTIERFLGWDNQTKAVLVGVGSLGTALLGYHGFQNFGFRFVGAFDQDPKKNGRWVHGRKVQAMDQLNPFVRRGEILLGVLTVPSPVAQATAELMVRAGIKGIWNFTPTKLQLPNEVVTQKEDLAEGLAVLSHRLHHKLAPVVPGDG